MSLRSKILRLAHQKPELRPHLLPLVKQGASSMDVHMEAIKVAKDAQLSVYKKTLALQVKVAKLMEREKFFLIPSQSYLGLRGSGSGDGAHLDGQLVFSDHGELFRTEDEAREIFLRVLDAYPSRGREFGLWTLHFSK